MTMEPMEVEPEATELEGGGTNVKPETESKLTPEANRFVMELEFVQLLAKPQYCQWLAANGYFDDPAFIKYLNYLQYWTQPKYARYLEYPQSLFYLRALQEESVRKEFRNPDLAGFAWQQQFLQWHFAPKKVVLS